MSPQFLEYLHSAAAKMLHASWQGAALAAVVLAISMVCGRRLDPRFRFLLWLLVFARLALPVLPTAPWSMFGWFSSGPRQLAAIAGSSSTTAQIAAPPASNPATTRAAAAPPDGPDAAPTVVLPAPAAAGWSVSAWGLAVSVWLLGTLILILRLVLGTIRLDRAKRRWLAPADPLVSAMFQRCRQQLGMRRAVSLWISDDGIGPATLGCFRSSIVIPRELVERLEPDDLRLVLVHELLHVRRYDLPIDRLACLVTAVHWPNPLAWIALASLRRNRELSCDVALLGRVGGEQARHYGHLILSTLEMLPGRRFQPTAVGIFDRSAGFSLRERIRAIAAYRKPSRPLTVLAGGLVLLVALVGLTDAEANQARVPEKMLADHLTAAEFQWNAVSAAYKANTVTLDRLLAGADDLWQAELAVANNDEERLAAHEKHVRNMKYAEEATGLNVPRFNRGRPVGEAEKHAAHAAAKYGLQSAEIELLQQQLAAKGAGDRPAREARLKQLLAERVATARKATVAYRAAYAANAVDETETVTLTDVIWAQDALWTAELAAAKNRQETLAAHIEHVRRLMQLEQNIRALWEVGQRGGEAEKYAASKAAREGAEIELVALCIANGQQYPQFEIPPGAANAKLPPNESLEERQKRLLAEQAVSARQAYVAYLAAHQADTVPFGSLVAAIEAAWQAELSAATTPKEIITAHIHHVQDSAQRLPLIEALHDVGAVGGEAEKLGTARYRCQSADIALLKACLATGQEYPKFDRYPNLIFPAPDSAEPAKP